MPQTSAAFQYQRVAEPNPGVFIFNPAGAYWTPAFPDRILPRVSVSISAQALYTQPLVPIDISHPELLRWVAKFPDHPDPKTSLQTSAQISYIANLDPLPNAPPPTDFPLPAQFPAFIPPLGALRRMSTALRASGGVLGRIPFSDVRWAAVYPNWLQRRPIRTALQLPFAAPPFGYFELPKLGGWRPVMPAWLLRRRPVPTGGYTFSFEPLLLNAAACVEWTDEVLTRPAFNDETLTHPAMIEESLLPARMTDEDLC